MNKIIREEIINGQVVRFTLNAPRANILDAEMMAELQTHLDNLSGVSSVKMIQFTGAGDHFSFGASVAEHTRENAAKMLGQFHRLFYTLADLAIPSAALISGQCLGGAMELALACNFIFLDRTAVLGQPEIKLGVFAPPASLILPLKIGQTGADDLLLTGRTLSADEVQKRGLSARVFDDRSKMISGVDEWVQKFFLHKSASSLRFAVKASRWQFNNSLKNRLKELESFYINELMESHDANEGINSFLEHRKPKWEAD